MALKIVTAPTEEPISRGEAKMQLNLDTSPPTEHPDDARIDRLIKVARRAAEKFLDRLCITQTWTLYLDAFPIGNYVEIPRPPLQCVNSITYLDSAGASQTVSFLDPSGTAQLEITDYLVDVASEPGRLYLKYGKSWPTTYGQAQAVQIEFVAGYGEAADVPEDIRHAMLYKISNLYENRGDEKIDARVEENFQDLLWPYRIEPV